MNYARRSIDEAIRFMMGLDLAKHAIETEIVKAAPLLLGDDELVREMQGNPEKAEMLNSLLRLTG